LPSAGAAGVEVRGGGDRERLRTVPAGAVVVNVQFDFAVDDVWRGRVAAPVTSTHLVSLLVTTVSVSVAPCLAYTVPPTLTVPAPPLNTALVTLAAEAVGALMDPIAVTIAASRAILRKTLPLRVVPPMSLLKPVTILVAPHEHLRRAPD
jgi:hypothetical protein